MSAAVVSPLIPAIPPTARRSFAVGASIAGCLLLALGLNGPGRAAEAATAPESDPPARIGFSRSMFRGVNENDANASLRTYAASLSRDARIPVAPEPILFDGLPAIRALLRDDAVDTISLTIGEFFSLEDVLQSDPLLIAKVAGTYTEEYVVAVHRDSGLARVADLRGRRILLLDNVRTGLAPLWLEVLLAAERLDPPAAFFGEMVLVAKPARVALPVFFKQEDACVITRHALDLLGELNPQVAAQLLVLATSPKVVPALTCFRANLPRGQADRFTAAIVRSHLWPAGKQVMTIFQCDRVEAQPPSILDGTRALWTSYQRLHARTGAHPPAPAAPAKGGSR